MLWICRVCGRETSEQIISTPLSAPSRGGVEVIGVSFVVLLEEEVQKKEEEEEVIAVVRRRRAWTANTAVTSLR